DQSVGLSERAVDVTSRLFEAMRSAPDSKQTGEIVELARVADDLATRLSAVGRRQDALARAHEAVALYRTLAERNPAAFQPNLAMCLTNLATMLSAVGRRSDALDAAQEAVALYRTLTECKPDAFQSDLPAALNNLASRLSDVG